jgi:signal transduction histidine kinase
MKVPEDGTAADVATSHVGAKQLNAARCILEAADADRRRFAQDLHDGAQQWFVAAVNNLQLAQRRITSEPDRASHHLDAALSQTESGLAALRDLVAGIHPPILTHFGLGAAVESLAIRLPIPVSLGITERRLSAEMEENVYFFVSEALTNVIKHARAGEARVQIATSQTVLTVEVSDDGIGGATLRSSGYGLVGLLARMQSLDGDLTLASPPMGGTVLHAVLPLGDRSV